MREQGEKSESESNCKILKWTCLPLDSMRDAHIPMLASEMCQNHANCPHVLLPPSAKTLPTSEKISLGQLHRGWGRLVYTTWMLRNKSFFNTVFDNSHFHSEAFTISCWCWNCHRCIIFHHHHHHH